MTAQHTLNHNIVLLDSDSPKVGEGALEEGMTTVLFCLAWTIAVWREELSKLF